MVNRVEERPQASQQVRKKQSFVVQVVRGWQFFGIFVHVFQEEFCD